MIIYRVVLPNGYVEFSTLEEAQNYLNANQGLSIEEITIPDQQEKPLVPDYVTRRQFKLVLLQLGKLNDVLNFIENTLPGLVSASEYSVIKIFWEESLHFERNNVYLNQLAPALGLSQEDLDNLFILASTL